MMLTMLVSCTDTVSSPSIDLQRVPDNGIHPRIIMDEWGDTHLLYFRTQSPESEAYLGHLYYTRYDNNTDSWQAAVQVSSEPFNYKDPIYRANFAVGGEGRIHIVWYVDRPARFLYARSDINKRLFEPPILIEGSHLEGVDANADIATYNNRVALVWGAGDLMQEDQRSIFMLKSEDYGDSFEDTVMIADAALGACACCALSAEFNQSGELFVAYRSAINNTGRHMQTLIITQNAHGDVQSSYLPVHAKSEWDISSCPVSTNDLVRDVSGDYWLAYETENRLLKMNLSGNTEPEFISALPSSVREKHPAMAFNIEGYQLIAWGEGGGFFSGGSLRRALFDSEGNQVSLPELEALEIPDRSFVAVMVKPDGNFLIVY
ncbi:MAG: hypothetical protein Q7L07_01060 [Pseudohongiella sp.]|nr:hypothetical protein [Pseudohongiella sp.]